MPRQKSKFVLNLDMIQAEVHSFLKPLGFRKKGRTHNRRSEGCLIHVVNYQMGEYPIGDYVIPGIRESYYGKFVVNLAVHLPCVYAVERPQDPRDFMQDYDCTIRDDLGSLASRSNVWFEITEDVGQLATTIVDLFDRFGLDFFDQFHTYNDVLAYYDAHGDLPFQNSGRASLEAALIAHHIGDAALSRSLFARAYNTDHKGFQQHVVKLAERVGVVLT